MKLKFWERHNRHKLRIRNVRPGVWTDYDEVLFHATFTLFCEFLERELGYVDDILADEILEAWGNRRDILDVVEDWEINENNGVEQSPWIASPHESSGISADEEYHINELRYVVLWRNKFWKRRSTYVHYLVDAALDRNIQIYENENDDDHPIVKESRLRGLEHHKVMKQLYQWYRYMSEDGNFKFFDVNDFESTSRFDSLVATRHLWWT